MQGNGGISRRGALAGLLAVPAVARAEAAWPQRPVRLVGPFAAGTATDAVLRILAPALSQEWGQPVVVENRPGGSGTVATETVLRSPPDGHVLGLGALPVHVANPILKPDLPFDIAREARVLVLIGTNRMVLVVHEGVPARDLRQFIAHVRANPGALRYGSGGNATPQHLAMELLKQRERLQIEMVPYPRGGLMPDLLAGRIQTTMYVGPLHVVQGGSLRVLGVAASQRFQGAPDIPSFAEQGVPEFESDGFFTLYAPRAVPDAVVRRVNAGVNAVLRQDDVRRALLEQQVVPAGGTPEAAAAHIAKARAQAERVIRTAGITAE